MKVKIVFDKETNVKDQEDFKYWLLSKIAFIFFIGAIYGFFVGLLVFV